MQFVLFADGGCARASRTVGMLNPGEAFVFACRVVVVRCSVRCALVFVCCVSRCDVELLLRFPLWRVEIMDCMHLPLSRATQVCSEDGFWKVLLALSADLAVGTR